MRLAIVVPFRLGSQRFPDKVIREFRGTPLLRITLNIAQRIGIGKIYVTAPQEDYLRAAESVDFGEIEHTFLPSSTECRSASERVLEVYKYIDADLILSIPVDEALLDPEQLGAVLHKFGEEIVRSHEAWTCWCPFFAEEDAISPLSAKIVCDQENRVLYMSRALIPSAKNGTADIGGMKKNVGAFFFPRSFLDTLVSFSDRETVLDQREGLEQLRWLELGLTLRAVPIAHKGFGIDRPEQIKLLEERAEC